MSDTKVGESSHLDDTSGVPIQVVRTESTYRALLDAAPEAMVVVRETGSIVVSNAQAERRFHYNRHELLGKPVSLIIPGFTALFAANANSPAKESWALLVGTVIPLLGRRKDGSEFPIELVLSLSTSKDGLLVTAGIRSNIAQAVDELHREELAAQQRAHVRDITERLDLEDQAAW